MTHNGSELNLEELIIPVSTSLYLTEKEMKSIQMAHIFLTVHSITVLGRLRSEDRESFEAGD